MSKIICSIVLVLSCLFSHAQEELHDHRLDENKWTEIRDGIRYTSEEGAGKEWTYESKREYEAAEKGYREGGNGDGPGARNGEEYRDNGSDLSMPSFNLNLSWLGWVFVILLLVALILLIIYLFLNAQRDGKKVIASYEIEELNPKEIPLTELERRLQSALLNQDFRGAIRVYFIFILRDLSLKNLIQWEKEKTNFQYLREMLGNQYYEDFNIVVDYFEVIWYGKREVDSTAFARIQPRYTEFLDKLGVK